MLPFFRRFLLLTLIFSGIPAFSTRTAANRLFYRQNESTDVEIRSPSGGEAVQGTVRITGNVNPAGLTGYDLAFGYRSDPTGTWFLIAEANVPVSSTTIAEWDTFQISDGIYDLRLRAFLTDGRVLVHRVEGVRVRNYSLVETSTPTIPAPPTRTATPDLTAVITPAPTQTEMPPPTVRPSATALPPNPAEFRPGAIPLSIARGAAGVLAVFVLLGLYTSIRSSRRK